MAKILDGRKVREEIIKELKTELGLLPRPLSLVIIQVGEREDSKAYIKQKKLFGEKLGIKVEHISFPAEVDEHEIVEKIKYFNQDPNVDGIIVQLPLPANLDSNKIIETIDPEKDVDGLTALNFKKLYINDASGLMPATAKGIITLFERYHITLTGKKVVIVGRSNVVGKPTALACLNRGATVTICHSETKDLAKETKKADILIVAAGWPNLITADYVTAKQIVIDVGINLQKVEIEGVGKTLFVGDVNFNEVEPIVKAISPVPGGVGPMTVISLFQNLLQAYRNNLK